MTVEFYSSGTVCSLCLMKNQIIPENIFPLFIDDISDQDKYELVKNLFRAKGGGGIYVNNYAITFNKPGKLYENGHANIYLNPDKYKPYLGTSYDRISGNIVIRFLFTHQGYEIEIKS